MTWLLSSRALYRLFFIVTFSIYTLLKLSKAKLWNCQHKNVFLMLHTSTHLIRSRSCHSEDLLASITLRYFMQIQESLHDSGLCVPVFLYVWNLAHSFGAGLKLLNFIGSFSTLWINVYHLGMPKSDVYI